MNNSHTLSWHESHDREQVRSILARDGVVLCSTDTVYGLLANVTDAAEQKLRTIKTERGDKPFLALIAGMHKLTHFAQVPRRLQKFLEQVWPGPVTCIIGAHALRCPDHERLRELLENFDGLYSTSANPSGKPVAKTRDEIDPELLDAVDAFIDDDQLDNLAPSTILDCRNPDAIVVLRQGAFPIKTLEEIYGTPFKRN